MKKNLVIIGIIVSILFLYCSNKVKQNSFILNGNIVGAANNDTVSLVFYKDYVTREDSVIKVPIVNGNFKIEVLNPQATEANLNYKNKRIKIFLTNSDILNIKIDGKNKNDSGIFEQKKYKDNICLKEITELIKSQKLYGRDIIQLFMRASGDSVMKAFNRFELEANKIYTKYGKELSPEFNSYIKNYIKYFKLRSLLNYPAYHEYYTNEKVDTSYFVFLEKVKIDYNPDIVTSNYISFLNNYIDYMFSKEEDSSNQENNYYINSFNLTKKLLKGKALSLILTSKLQDAIRYSQNQDEVNKIYNEYLNICQNEHYKNIISKLKKDYDKLSSGNPAPEINLKDINGKDFKLSDLKGSVVYIKFWASWCGPCKREIPFDIEIEKYFKGKNVKFLRVSLDEDELAWRKMVAEKKLGGINVRCNGFDSEVAKSYLIYGVPTYYIIDKNGNIGMRNAPRPSNKEEAIKTIKKFL